MKNFIFVSPHFPPNFYKFIIALAKNGFRVLGIGDAPYDSIPQDLRNSLTEYYRCYNMEDFNQEIEAVRYFENKFGHIDYLESNNEYWLERDARLRAMFNITTGIMGDDIHVYQYKSLMKERYIKAGCKVAKYIIVDTKENMIKFAADVGFPIFVKPDMGVGAAGDYKIRNYEEIEQFFAEKDPYVRYICEQFVTGNIISFDGVCDSNSNVIFCDSEIFPPSISEVLKQQLDVFYYCLPSVPDDVREIGEKVIKSFEVKNRYFHLEFFRLTKDIKNLGKIGDIVGLETNMRPPGGFTPDLINFANSVDTYQIYADSMAYDENRQNMNFEKFYAACASRRDGRDYFYSEEQIKQTYKNELCAYGRYPDVLSGCMGNLYYMAKFKNLKDLEVFHQYVNRRVGEPISSIKTEKPKNDKEPICDRHVDGA